MSLGRFYRVAAGALAAMAAVSAWGFWRVGPDAIVPIHWNAAGVADDWGSAGFAFLLTPAIAVGLVALLAVIPRIEPRRANLERSAAAYRTVAIGLVLLMLAVHVVVVLAGTGVNVPVGIVIGGGVGMLFVVMGNVLATVRSNFLFGVRTPWTLSSDLAWDRTHRAVGRLFVAAGVSLVLLGLVGNAVLLTAFMVAFITAILVVAFAYSYRVWKSDPARRPIGGGS